MPPSLDNLRLAERYINQEVHHAGEKDGNEMVLTPLQAVSLARQILSRFGEEL